MYQIKVTEEMGRGLYASTSISPGTVIMQCELLVLDENDTAKINETSLQYYSFKYDNTRDCLVLGCGELFNHSDSPNVTYKLIDFEGRKVMLYIAVSPINAGDQLLIDYALDTKVEVNNYKVNLYE